MIDIRKEIRSALKERNVSNEEGMRLDRLNHRTNIVIQRTYDFAIGQLNSFDLTLKNKKALMNNISDAISEQIMMEFHKKLG